MSTDQSTGSESEITRRADLVRMILLDVDGVLTDGSIMLGGDGMEVKRFDVQDGQGIVLAREAGLKTGIITGRKSAAVEQRAQELKLDVVCQGSGDKVESLQAILDQFDLDSEHVAYIGDDWTDISIMRAVGLPLAVANARPEVRSVACHVSQSSGGNGAVRELIEWLLDRKGLKEQALRRYLLPAEQRPT